jgi:hypothetical protein
MEREVTDRTLLNADLEGFARRVANNAIQSAEIADPAAVYCGHLFREFIYAEALSMLRTVVQHERQEAGHPLPDWLQKQREAIGGMVAEAERLGLK